MRGMVGGRICQASLPCRFGSWNMRLCQPVMYRLGAAAVAGSNAGSTALSTAPRTGCPLHFSVHAALAVQAAAAPLCTLCFTVFPATFDRCVAINTHTSFLLDATILSCSGRGAGGVEWRRPPAAVALQLARARPRAAGAACGCTDAVSDGYTAKLMMSLQLVGLGITPWCLACI